MKASNVAQAFRRPVTWAPMVLVSWFFLGAASPTQAQAGGPCDAATIVGTGGPDILIGTGGNDIIKAFAGPDVVHGGDGADIVCGDEGPDVLFLNNMEHSNDSAYGGDGNDVIYLGPGDDFADGGPNFDVCYGGLNSDTFVNCELIIDLGCQNECPFP